MAPNRGHKTPKHARSQHHQDRNLKRKREIEDIESLSQRVADLDPKAPSPSESFSSLPLSQTTLSGLEASHFKKLTAIQARAIPASLKGGDILGSAKTGSGKTLAFIVPILENLYRKRWTEHDGLGALILSPTRELAIQIFDVLRKVGRNHSFSAGLVIGGRSLQEERDRLGRINILIATPGRMLQHMDQNADLDVGNLQMLVLDEADRIMDMGFQSTVDAIVEHVPRERQTLLFSATQTRKVSDLARLSLQDPEFVSVEEESDNATPTQLSQNFVVTPLPQKLDTLWSFIRSNTKKKILVFLSSGKQVRFVYEGFRHLQPGISLLHLHGRQKQSARMEITTKFSNSKYACLFSTDIAARGLDFPAVDWVVQVDCPEDADTYIHRVGRTARYSSSGRAVLLLDPSEKQGMLDALERKKVVGVEEIHVREKKMQNTIQNQLQDMCFKDPELKYLGQKAFVSYVRSVFVQKDKAIFDVKKLDLETFAASLGLPGAPRVKFVKGEDVKRLKNMPRALAAMENGDSGDDEETRPEKSKEKQVRTKYDRMFERRNQDVLTEHYTNLINDDDMKSDGNSDATDDDAGDFLAVKTRFDIGDTRLGQNHDISPSSSSESETKPNGQANAILTKPNPTTSTTATEKAVHLSANPNEKPLIVDSKRREKLLQSKKALLKYRGHGRHLVFDSDNEDDNQGHERVYYEKEEDFQKQGGAEEQRERFLTTEKERAQRADEVDREVARQKKREKKIKKREREKELANLESDDDGDVGVQLVPYNEGDRDGSGGVDNDDTEPDFGLDDVGSHPDKERKRKRKWFEDSESDHDRFKSKSKTKKKSRGGYNDDDEDDGGKKEEPQTLEDLEALASGLLAS